MPQEHSQFSLLGSRRFGPYFATQFLGAFNDNVFKNALVVLVTFQTAALTSADINLLVNLAAGLFILPFFLFSGIAGQIADRADKSLLVRRIKVLEIAIMGLACVGFLTHNLPLLFAVLFLMGAQSSLFGPVKYGLLPQHLRRDELIGGNALVQAGTYLAILIGTIAGGRLQGVFGPANLWVSVAVVGIAVLGYLASRGIPPAPSQAPDLRIDWNPLRSSWRIIQESRANRTVFLSILGISWFWFVGATYMAQLPNYTRSVLGGDESVFTLLLALFSIGIGLGSLLCERLSAHKVEMGLVPFGAIGLSLFGLDLSLATPAQGEAVAGAAEFLSQAQNWRVALIIVALGTFGGFYIVPLYALVQSRSDPAQRSRMIAANNILNALFMVGSALLAIALLGAGLSIPQLFLTVAVMNAAIALYIFRQVPEFLMRFLVWLLVHSVYHLRSEGLDRIPKKGPALLVCNHVSYVDALIIAACVGRPVRFVMDQGIYRLPLLNFIFRTARAIPIGGRKDAPELLETAMRSISEALRADELVCIFPEGMLTRSGEINRFRRGVERIVQTDPVPVVSMALSGLWGSLFSRHPAGWPRRLWRGLRAPIRLSIGAPEDLRSADAMRERVAALRGAVG